MALDTVMLSRLQFAWTIGYHILWPAYTIGIAGFIALLNALWLATGKPVYRDLLRFWIHLFALGFAMGVVTGVVLSYEIGTNWAGFADRTANVLGPFFTYEVLTAFFLEAGFVGVVLFGMNRVGPRFHLFACCMVAVGTIFSAFWILAANSWMQTPAGFTVDADGRFQIANWWQAIFNPSLPYRFFHMVTAAYTMLGIALLGLWLRWRGRLYDSRWFGMICAFSSPLGFIAVLAGWTVTETGRQPYVVYGLLRTAEAAAPISPHAVATSLVLFILVYLVLLLAFFFYAGRLVLHGPHMPEPAATPAAVRPGVDGAPAAGGGTPTLEFTGVGVAVILPITLAYLGYAHWIFRGKTTGGYGGEE